MARERRIDSLGEAREMRRGQKEELVGYFMPDTSVGPKGVHGVTGTGMNGVEVDLGALREADAALDKLQDELQEHRRKAINLTDALHNGASPIAKPMHRAFLDRADAEGGVQGTLEDYIEELTEVRLAIRETLAAYEELDADAAARLSDGEVD